MATIFDMRINRLVSLKQRYRQVRKSNPNQAQDKSVSFFLRKGKEKFEEQGVQTPAVTEGFVSLYVKEFLLD